MWRICTKCTKIMEKKTYSRSVRCISWWSFIFFLIQSLLSGASFLSFRDLVSPLLWFDFSYLKQDFHVVLFTLNCLVYLWYLNWQGTIPGKVCLFQEMKLVSSRPSFLLWAFQVVVSAHHFPLAGGTAPGPKFIGYLFFWDFTYYTY